MQIFRTKHAIAICVFDADINVLIVRWKVLWYFSFNYSTSCNRFLLAAYMSLARNGNATDSLYFAHAKYHQCAYFLLRAFSTIIPTQSVPHILENAPEHCRKTNPFSFRVLWEQFSIRMDNYHLCESSFKVIMSLLCMHSSVMQRWVMSLNSRQNVAYSICWSIAIYPTVHHYYDYCMTPDVYLYFLHSSCIFYISHE